jgi:plastocyanin
MDSANTKTKLFMVNITAMMILSATMIVMAFMSSNMPVQKASAQMMGPGGMMGQQPPPQSSSHGGMMGNGMMMHSNIGTNTTASDTKTPSGIIVSIVKEAEEKTDKAYQPNPINIKVGDTITWINRDSETHTVTSGSGDNDPNEGKEFDSGPLKPAGIFTHTFKTAGEFNYFCDPHPWMVAKVIVK